MHMVTSSTWTSDQHTNTWVLSNLLPQRWKQTVIWIVFTFQASRNWLIVAMPTCTKKHGLPLVWSGSRNSSGLSRPGFNLTEHFQNRLKLWVHAKPSYLRTVPDLSCFSGWIGLNFSNHTLKYCRKPTQYVCESQVFAYFWICNGLNQCGMCMYKICPRTEHQHLMS